MSDLKDGEQIEVQGSAARPYVLKNRGGVYSCSCPAWRNQSAPPERRSCKHLRALRGADTEAARIAQPEAETPAPVESAPGKPRPWWKQFADVRPPLPAPAAAAPTRRAEGAAPPLLLAHSWDNDRDLSGWWMSEKLDGVRAYWDGARFVSRLGNAYAAPDWFTAGLPPTPLDGELWAGRKRFQRTVSIVRRQDKSDDWREIAYVVFDAPAIAAPFEERVRTYEEVLSAIGAPFARAHESERCRDLAHLRAELARVEGLGGEGLMLRQPGSRYEIGRSHTLLKVKSFLDAEARVVAHLPGAGKHKGRLGALLVETPAGIRFAVGTGLSDAERALPPPIGSIITYRYQELSDGGVPRFPSYVGVRHDVAF